MKKYVLCAIAICLASAFHLSASATDIVLYGSDVTTMQGSWTRVSGAGAAGGAYMGSTDNGWSSTDSALASPSQYFESTFTAASATPYHVWLRLRAGGDSKWNDSVWVQFSDATDQNGSAIYRIGTTSALLVNLENCSGCGVSGWGWQDKAYWLSQLSTIKFPSTGTHTVRVQTREDGVEVDQIVLSPSLYMSSAPGGVSGDGTIVAKPGSTGSGSGPSGSSAGAFHGTPAAVPGTIQAEDFDNGGEGVGYHDTDSTNSGGAYRQTGVDIESTSGGGYDVGWIASGEWMNYTVNVASAGTYTVQLRVASPGGGSMHVGFNTASNVWQTVAVPGTGGWQTWTTVSFTATLGAGTQQMTLLSDTGGYNLDAVTIASGGSAPVSGGGPAPTPPSGSGTTLPVITWNIQINDNSETHARVAMDLLAAQGPQAEVVVIEEAYLMHLPVYIDELQKQTGKTWYGVFGTECAPGQWNGSSCASQWYQGSAIMSTHPITSSSTKYFPYVDCWSSARVGLRAAIDLNGTPVQVFALHLQTGGCQNDAASRYNSMRDFKSWAGGYSQPQLVAGDFNADPDQIDTTQGMSPNFTDSWFVVGAGSRFTALGANPTMKLDYWFADNGARATPIESRVITSTGSVSDHLPLQTTFVVR